MDIINPILSSTFFLISILMVGLIFFIKSSVKERIKEMTFYSATLSEDQILQSVRNYLQQRAYSVVKLEPENEVVILSGRVKPSIFVALLLTSLSAIGLVCLGLVLATLIPNIGDRWWLVTIAAPIAGVFYWRGADREEQISLQLLPESQIKVCGHKDELTNMQRSLNLEKVE